MLGPRAQLDRQTARQGLGRIITDAFLYGFSVFGTLRDPFTFRFTMLVKGA